MYFMVVVLQVVINDGCTQPIQLYCSFMNLVHGKGKNLLEVCKLYYGVRMTMTEYVRKFEKVGS